MQLVRNSVAIINTMYGRRRRRVWIPDAEVESVIICRKLTTERRSPRRYRRTPRRRTRSSGTMKRDPFRSYRRRRRAPQTPTPLQHSPATRHRYRLALLYYLKLKAKAYIAHLTGKPDQLRFTIIEMAVDRQEPMVLQR